MGGAGGVGFPVIPRNCKSCLFVSDDGLLDPLGIVDGGGERLRVR